MPRREGDSESFLSTTPEGCRFQIQAIGAGLIFPCLFAAYGIWCLAWGEAALPAKHGSNFPIQGTAAYTFGAALVLMALSLHFHFFWGNSATLDRYHQPLKVISLAGALALYIVTLVLAFPYL